MPYNIQVTVLKLFSFEQLNGNVTEIPKSRIRHALNDNSTVVVTDISQHFQPKYEFPF